MKTFAGHCIFILVLCSQFAVAQDMNRLLVDGHMRATEGDYTGAIADFNEVASLFPWYHKVYYFRGNAELMAGKYNEAIADFNKTIQVDSNNIEAIFYRAICYFEIKNYLSALKDFNAILAKDPDFSEAYVERGELELLMNNKAQARVDFKHASDLGNNKGATALEKYDKELR